MLLVCGGAHDPSLHRFIAAAQRRRCEFQTCLFDTGVAPTLAWDLEQDVLRIQGVPLAPRAVFMRQDVFNAMQCTDNPTRHANAVSQANGWQAVWRGWLLTHQDALVFNRRHLGRTFSKPQQLVLAPRAGLRVTHTVIGNDLSMMRAQAAHGPSIVKPVSGGDLAMELDAALARCPSHASAMIMTGIVQKRLVAPEYRIFLVGSSAYAFRVDSPLLDYRADQTSVNVTFADMTQPELAELEQPLRALAGMIGLDFCAADFKTDPETGELMFLEVNEQPMFARFDDVSGGVLCDSMVEALVGSLAASGDVSPM